MSRTFRKSEKSKKSGHNVVRKDNDARTQVEDFLAEYEHKNQNPFIKLRDI